MDTVLRRRERDLAAEEDAPDLGRPEQLRGAAVDHRASALQHVAAGGDGERQLDVLLDEEQGHAVAVDAADRLRQALDDLGREAEERLVDHEQPRPRHEAARDGDHLLLAAGQRVRRLAGARGDDREELGDALVFGLAGAAGRRVIAAEPDVLAHAEVREEAPPLEHVGDAAADDAVSGQTRDGLALEGDGARAQQARDAVHQGGLAAAVGAEEGDHLAALDGQARPPERLVVAEQDVEARDLEHHGRHAWPRYASMTRGLRTISDGGASAMTSPSWSATIRWASSMITRMLCSMTTSARPPACSSRTRRTSPGMVAWSTPPVTSSSSSSRGRVASARASSRRLRCPVDSPRAWASTRSARPTEASAWCAASRATATSAVLRNAPTMTFSRTVMSENGRSFWKVRATPRCAISSGRSRVTSAPSRLTRPASARWKPVTRSKSVDLPAPFGPITPTSSPGATANETSRLAITPPKRLVRPLTLRRLTYLFVRGAIRRARPTRPDGWATATSTISAP